jgi:DNA-binding XRE family transcriptional regulator
MPKNKKIKKIIHNNISKYRIWKNVRQIDLANALNCPINQFREIEKGLKQPSDDQSHKILEYFGVSFDQMFIDEL